METIKTWQERGGWDKNFVPQYDGMPAWEAIKAENAELRAALAKQADAALVGPTETEYAAVFANDVLDEVMKERDHYHDIADGLAESIAEYFGADIGEHSSANCPWAEALRVIEEAPAIAQRVVSEAVPVTLKDTVKNQAMTSFALAGQVNDLSVLCRRLLHALNNEKPNHPIAIKAADYLKRNSLQGNPVRAEDVLRDTTPPAAPVALSDADKYDPDNPEDTTYTN